MSLMNRRAFNTALAALLASPALPIPVTARATPAVTNGTSYLFADLIARSRGHVDAGFLARRLNLNPKAASAIMTQLAANNVIHAPVAGVAQAVKPLATKTAIAPVANHATADRLKTAAKNAWNAIDDTTQEMAVTEDDTDAIPTKYRRYTDS